MPISVKHGKRLGNIFIPTILNVVILPLTIKLRHPIIIRYFWLSMQLKGDILPLFNYIYLFIIKRLNLCLDNWTTIFGRFCSIFFPPICFSQIGNWWISSFVKWQLMTKYYKKRCIRLSSNTPLQNLVKSRNILSVFVK